MNNTPNPAADGGEKKRILGDLRIFQAIHNDLNLSHEIVTDGQGRQVWAYTYSGTDPYELEDNHFPSITAAIAKQDRLSRISEAKLARKQFTMAVDDSDFIIANGERIKQLNAEPTNSSEGETA